MLVYAILSPRVFESDYFEQPGYRDQVALFFRGLQANAVLLLDPGASLLDDIDSNVAQLSIKFRQELEIRLAELRKSLREKKRRRNVVKLDAAKCNTASNQSPLKRCVQVATSVSPDAVFLPDDEIADLSQSGTPLPLVRMTEYSRSDYEERRRYFMEDLPPIDQRPREEFDALIIRGTRLSVWVRIYDKQIGKGSNLSNFRRGVKYIHDLWVANAHFHPQYLEIVTCDAEHLNKLDSQYAMEQKKRRIRECTDKVMEQLVKPLKESLGTEIKISFKQDSDRIFHARHLQAQNVIMLLERGFDIQDDDGTLRRNIVKVDNGAQIHLQECRQLPESVSVLA